MYIVLPGEHYTRQVSKPRDYKCQWIYRYILNQVHFLSQEIGRLWNTTWFRQNIFNSSSKIWRAPILYSSTRKVLYRFFDLGVIKHALAKQNIVTLKERASWNGHVLVAEHEKQGDADPVQALLAAKRKAHGEIPRARITCISNLIVGYGEGRATREIDVIWCSNLYHTSLVGKMSIRLLVSRVHLE